MSAFTAPTPPPTTPSSHPPEPATRAAVNGWAPDHPDDPVPPPDEQTVTTVGKPNVTTHERRLPPSVNGRWTRPMNASGEGR